MEGPRDETAARVAAGALAKLVLQRKGIEIDAGVRGIAGIEAKTDTFNPPFAPPLFLTDNSNEGRILEKIEESRRNLDSLGGVVECRISGCPAGIGEP